MNVKKKISVLGDSISTFEGYSEPKDAVFYDMAKKLSSGVLRCADTWWGQVVEGLEGELLTLNAISGSTVCGGPRYEAETYGCSDLRTSSLGRESVDPDVILVYLGTNDWGRGTPLRPEEGSEADPTCFFLSAYDLMLKKLKGNYPKAEICAFTLARSRFDAAKGFTFPFSYGGRHIEEYCEVIRTCALRNDCRLVDLYRTAEPYDTIDGFHANASGMTAIASAVLSLLKSAD